MKISVIIPAFNEEKLLEASLAEIKTACTAFIERGWESELIVCDNNSTDRTPDLARAAGARVVFEPVNQIARARNAGAAAADGDWLLFVDADSEPNAALLSDVADQISGGRCAGGGATVLPDESSPTAHFVVTIWNRLSRWRTWAPGFFIFCDATVFRHIGGFNESRFAGEDVDLSRRLKRYARANGRTVVILRRHPVITSARKLRLYRKRDYVRFLLRTLLTARRNLTDKNECRFWYDGLR